MHSIFLFTSPTLYLYNSPNESIACKSLTCNINITCNLQNMYLQGWSPEPEEYKDLPQRNPEGHTSNTQSPYLQLDLLKPYNITGKHRAGAIVQVQIEMLVY